MTRRAYFCGRCGKRFSMASKYCPSCGAILSMPVGSHAAVRDGAVHYEDTWSSVRNSILPEILFILALLIALYFGMRNATANVGDTRIRVVTTDKYVDVIDGQPYKLVKKTLIVDEQEMGKYSGENVIPGLNPAHKKQYAGLPLDEIIKRVADGRIRAQLQVKSHEKSKRNAIAQPAQSKASQNPGIKREAAPMVVLAETPRMEHNIAVQIGMTPRQVREVWGRPKSQQRQPRNGQIYEMWRFGDPEFDVDTGSRYVEFGADNRVVTVRDGAIIIRKAEPDLSIYR